MLIAIKNKGYKISNVWNAIPENQFTLNIIFSIGYFLNFFFILFI